jgi:hypothetical protein
MRVFVRFLLKAVVVFLLWAFIGVCLHSIGTNLLARGTDSTTTRLPLIMTPTGEQLVEGNAVLVAKISMTPVDLEFDAEKTGYALNDRGLIYRIGENGSADSVPWLILPNDATEKAVPFRAMALHPGFLDPDSRGFGRFYTIEPEKAGTGRPDFTAEYGAEDGEHHQDVLCEYRTEGPRSRVFTGVRKVLARFSQPGAEHNVSDLAFDRLGRLFVSVGDGAAADPGRSAPSRNAMSLANAFGKVLRIDPLGDNSANGQYGIPPRNPFLVIEAALPEIWCYGLRDPQRLEFDPYRDWLTIVDLGQDGIEEVNISEAGGEHFGWDMCEGTFFYPPSRGKKPSEGVTGPVAEYERIGDERTAGGFVYRGLNFPTLSGRMLMASTSGRILSSRIGGGVNLSRLVIGNQSELLRAPIVGIRPGPTGELFLLTRGGGIYELQKQTTAAGTRKSRKPLLCWAL